MKKAMIPLLMIAIGAAALTVSGVTYARIAESGYSAKAEGEETPTEPTEPTEEEIDTEEKLTEKVRKWLSQYLDARLVADIITWATTGGLMTALFAVYIKYRRYKATTVGELVAITKAEVGKALKQSFEGLSKEEIKKLTDGIDSLRESNDKVIKALVLAQDKSSEGKIALLKLVSEGASKDVKEAAKVAEESVKKEEKATEEVKKAVGEFQPIE